MSQIPAKPARYQHFILLLWQEHNGQGKWRISLLDPNTEVRIGFKNLHELTAFLEKWMKESSEDSQTDFLSKEKKK